jgi:hypothetical protein
VEDLMAGGTGPGHTAHAMTYRAAHRHKPKLSGHQKQMRFLTGLAMLFCSLLFAAMLWYVNRPGLLTR